MDQTIELNQKLQIQIQNLCSEKNQKDSNNSQREKDVEKLKSSLKIQEETNSYMFRKSKQLHQMIQDHYYNNCADQEEKEKNQMHDNRVSFEDAL